MEVGLLEKKFELIGARLRVREFSAQAGWRERGAVAAIGHVLRVDVRSDAKGEFFDVLASARVGLEIADCRPSERHLLLLARNGANKEKFLCGHDERHWFVAAVPDGRGASNVRTAIEALKPELVVAAQEAKRLGQAKRQRRKNDAFIRQGEWFFIPAPGMDVKVNGRDVLANERLSRGSGKPHLCQFLYRTGGRTVYVCRQYPTGVSEETQRRILAKNPDAKHWGWFPMQRDPEAYARGWVRHPDHATIYLNGWHRVAMNTEHRARAMAHVAFLD